MTQARQPREPAVYPPDPASWYWDAAFAAACSVAFAGGLLLGRGEASATGAAAPYCVTLLLLHVVTAVALYVYARPRTGRMIAFGVGLTFLLLGSTGADRCAASLSWSVATATGAWALAILLGPLPIRSAWLAGGLLLVGVAVSTVGLFFLVPAIVVLLPGPRRRYLWVVVPAVVALALWLAVRGPEGQIPPIGGGAALEAILVGIATSIGRVSGLGPGIGLVLAVLLGLATLNTLLSDSMRLGLVAGSAGLITQFMLMAGAQENTGAAVASMSPGVYPAAVFFFVAISSWLAHRPLDRPGHRLRLLAVVVLLVLVTVAGNTH